MTDQQLSPIVSPETIPAFILYTIKTLQDKGFEAYLVGGCVRDMLIHSTTHMSKDWDITTNAHPDAVQAAFPLYKTVYENNFGTVTVLNMPAEEAPGVTRETPDANNIAQITTYRSEGTYTDNRRPDTVQYETELLKDLERRDFTMNAIAYDPFALATNPEHGYKGQFIDAFGGIKDIKDKVIRCVLYPDIRFQEDALRMLRAVRFSTVLNFAIEGATLTAITSNKELLAKISQERIRDEFFKMIDSEAPATGIILLQKTGLLHYIVPELEEGIGCEQKGAHIYDVYDHLLHALAHAADKKLSRVIRLTALFHDIGKPATRRYDRTKDKYTFFGHEVVGARMTKKILDRLKVPRETSDLVVSLVRNHMFFSDTEQITLSAVRRIIQKVSPEHIWELMQVRECDRVGMKKAEAPYRLRKYHAMIDEALRDPITVGALAIDGTYLIETLHMKPGRRMGWILHALLEEVLEDPTLNTVETLKNMALDMDKKDDSLLQNLGQKGKERKEEINDGEIKQLHMKHGVKK